MSHTVHVVTAAPGLIESAIPGIIVGIVSATVAILLGQRVETMAKKRKLGDMLGVEIMDIVKIMGFMRLERHSYDFQDSGKTLPRKVYDGLVNSGNIAEFDLALQRDLYYFYECERTEEYEQMWNMAEKVFDEVEDFRRKNKWYWRKSYKITLL